MKHALNLLIAFFIIGSFSSVTVVNAEKNDAEFKLYNIEGEIVKNENTTKVTDDIYLKSANINHQSGIVNGTSNIAIDGEEIELSLNGELYPVKGDSSYDGKLILGDMKPNNDYNILKFRIENDKKETILSIVLEDKKSGEWIRFKTDIEAEVFKSLYKNSNKTVERNNMENRDILEKVAQLSNMHNKAEHGEKQSNNIPSMHYSSERHYESKSSIFGVRKNKMEKTKDNFSTNNPSWTTTRVNFTELKRMLEDLSKPNTKSVNLEDYDLPESLFKGSGLKKDVDTSPESTPGNNYYAVSAQQLDMTMTQLAVFMHDFHFTKRDGDEINYDMGVTYDQGTLLEYDHHTKDIKVFIHNFGLTLQNFALTQGDLNGKNVYTVQNFHGTDLTKDKDVIQFLAGRVPYGTTIIDLWDILSKTKSTTLNSRDKFIGQNFDEQMDVHGGEIYKASSGVLSGWVLDSEEANVNLLSEMHAPTTPVSLRRGFKTNVGTNLVID